MRKLVCSIFWLLFLSVGFTQSITISGSQFFCEGSSKLLSVTDAGSLSIIWEYSATGNAPWNMVNTGLNHTATLPGSYRISTTTPPVSYDTIVITVNPKPVANFTFNNNNACSGTPVQFNSTITSGTSPFNYIWRFGDGGNSTSANPVYSFVSLGCSTVNLRDTLIIRDAKGCADTVINSIAVIQKPNVELEDQNTFSPFSNCVNSPTQANPNFSLTVRNISPDSACITSYSIDWGDGDTSANISFPITHIYTQLGAFNLKVTAVGSNNCVNSKIYRVANQSNPAIGIANLGSTQGCALLKIPIVISSWQQNSPGTTYLLLFGDGESVTLNHPINADYKDDTVSHTYEASPCPAPSYQVQIIATNACQSTPFAGGNIQVRTKPKPNFVISPNPVCAGQQVCFSDSTVLGHYINCSTTTIYSWNFGDPSSGSNNTSTLANVCHTFTAPGTYEVKLSTSNPCGADTIIKLLCVSETPLPSFTIDTITGCSSLSVNVTNTSNTLAGGCAPTTYEWSVNYMPSFCEIAASWNFINGTNKSSVNPSFQFANAGTYEIILKVSNPCGTFSTSKIITVKKPPTVTLSPLASSCGPITISPNATVSNCGTDSLHYLWTFEGGLPDTSYSPNPSVTFSATGTHTITLAVRNECGTTTASQQITVNPVPAILVPASDTLCAGETAGSFDFTSTSPAATFTWINSNTAIGLAGGDEGNIPAFVTTNVTALPISSLIKVTVSNGLCTRDSSFTITVNPTPPLPGVSPVNYCKDETALSLTATVSAGHTLLWYTTATGGSGSQTAPTPSTTATGTTIYYVSQVSATSGCEGPRAAINVTVYPVPNITSSSSTNPLTCGSATGSVTLNGLLPNTTYTVRYIKNGASVSVVLTSDAAGAINIIGLTAGLYTNFYVEANNCSSNEQGPFTLSDPTPPATPDAGSNAPICSGGTLHLTASTTSAGVTYQWTGPNGFTSNEQNPAIANAPVSAGGTYFVTVTANSCISAADSVSVVINATPATPSVSSNSPACTGNTLNLTALTSSTGVTYQWTGPDNFTSDQQNPVIPNITLADSGVYNVTAIATSGNCPSETANTRVVIYLTPNISGTNFTNPESCASATGSITLTGLTPATTYTINYTRNAAQQTIPLTADASGMLTISNLTAGAYANINVVLNNCPSNIVGPIILSDPNPPATPTVSSNDSICVNAALNLSASTSSPGLASYLWIGPDGFSSTEQNPIINTVSAANAGYYYATATINNCTSLRDSVFVVVNPLGNLPLISSPVQYCLNANAFPLTATADPPNTLNWYNTANGGSPSSAPIPLTTVTGTTNYYVSQTTQIGCEGPRSIIEVRINPDAKALFIPVDTIKCFPFEITNSIIGLQLFPANNSNYEWYANGIFIGSGESFPGDTIVNDNDSVTIKLKAISLFGCKNDSMSRKFYTYKSPQPSFTISDSVGCGPFSVQIQNTTADISLFNYIWDFGNGQTSAASQPGSIIFNASPSYNDTAYTIQLKAFLKCDTFIFSKTIRVKSKPKALYTPSARTGCSPMRVVFMNTSLGNNNTYYWDFSNGSPFVTSSSDTFSRVFMTGSADIFNVKLNAVNECGEDSIIYPIVIAPNNIKLSFSLNFTDRYGCAPDTVAFINNSSGASAYQWDFGDNNSLTTSRGIDTVYHIYSTHGQFTVRLLAYNNCTDTSAFDFVTIYPKPTASFISNKYTACVGEALQLTNQSAGANAYLWQFGDGTASSVADTQHSYSAPGTYTIKLISYSTRQGATCIDSTERQVEILSGLPGSFSVSDTSALCAPFTVTFVNRNAPSVIAIWNFGDSTTGSGDSVKHTYNNPGIYNVSLTAVVAGGCTYTSNKIVTVSGPTGALEYAGGYVCYPNTVTLQATVFNTNLFTWNFGDGNTLTTTASVASHIYSNPGQYIPSVTLQDAAGCSKELPGTDTIKVDKINAGFTWNQQQICGSTSLTFIDTSHVFFGKASVKWDFGDGNTATGITSLHNYLISGSYTVQMTITGNSGCVDTVRKQLDIHVNNIPVTSIIADTAKCANQSINFLSNIVSKDAVNLTQWDLSNGVSGNESAFSHFFNVPQTYLLQLITGTVNGCYDTAYHTIVIRPVPIVSAGSSVTLCLGNSSQLFATGATSFQWTPVEGLNCTACSGPVASPTVTTPYVVAGSNIFGCAAYDTVVITIIQPMQLTVIPEQKICIGNSANLLASGATSYTWSPAQDLNNTTISNPTASPKITTQYRVVGYDGFNCFTDTAFVSVGVGQYPKVDLGPDLTLSTGTQHPLATTIQNGPIMQWLWTPATNLDCPTCPLPVAEIKKDITYSVRVTTEYGCTASDTINIKVFCEDAQVFVPNAFTPDGDGKNDILMVRGKGIVNVKYFRIFNRWGELIFEKNNFPPNSTQYGWDGRIRGVVGPPDVFVFTAEVECENGVTYVYKGNTSIIK